MQSIINLLQDIGAFSLEEIWFPIGIWTVAAVVVLTVLNFKKNLDPLYHYHLRIATILSLPAGILVSMLTIKLLDAFAESGSSEMLVFFANPLVVNSNEALSTQINWMSPSLWVGVATVAILLSSIYLLIRLALNLYRLHKISRNLDFMPLSNLETLEKVHHEVIRNIQGEVLIAFSNDFKSPFTFGWNTPVIVVPEFLRNNTQDLNLVIGHELIHIRRKDYHIHVILSFLSALFSFNPVYRLAKKQINDFREISCDQEVITEFQASPKSYAKLIFSLMQQPDHKLNLQVSLVEHNSNLKKRISTMKYHNLYKSSYKKSLTFIMLLCMVIMLPIACTEMSSEVDLSDVNESPLSGNLKLNYSDDISVIIDGKPADLSEVDLDMDVNQIQSITVNKIDDGKQVIVIKTKENKDVVVNGYKAGSKPSDNSMVFTVVENMPEMDGGLDNISKNIRYPQEARDKNIEGRVIVKFIVTSEGNVRDAQIVRGIGAGCDEEALRVVSEAKFTPGKQRGRNVDVEMNVPIVFKLN